jgi:hypothetical protein
MFINVSLNETIDLDCVMMNRTGQSRLQEIDSSSLLNNQSLNDSLNDDEIKTENLISIFKKNQLVFKMHATSLKLTINNSSDQGLYECGHYLIDKFGVISYEARKLWHVKIESEMTNFSL